MKSCLPPPLLLLLALSIPSIAAPIPLRLEECLRCESCRFALPTIYSQEKGEEFTTDSTPRPAHPYLPPSNQDNAGDVSLLVNYLEQHAEYSYKPQPLDKKLEFLLRAAWDDKISKGVQTIGRTEAETIPIIEASHVEILRKTDAKSYRLAGLSKSVWRKVESIASKSLQRCRTHQPTIIHHNSVRRDRWIIVYSYGYRCVRTGYTDVLVVGIVVLFVAVILMVEMLDRAIDMARRFLSLDQGLIRLEVENCVRPDHQLPHWLTGSDLIPITPRRKSISASVSKVSLDEKTIES